MSLKNNSCHCNNVGPFDRFYKIKHNLAIACRVFPRLFTHGRDKALMGGTDEGGHRPYGGLTLIDFIIN